MTLSFEDKISEARACFEQDGVAVLRGVLDLKQVEQFRKDLEEVFARDETNQKSTGFRTDMSKAADKIRQDGHGDDVLTEGQAFGTGRFLTELDVSRWHHGVRDFTLKSSLPEVVGGLLGESNRENGHVRFFNDHAFLKEAGSALQTAWHQDTPYFPFNCGAGSLNLAVCWVPVDVIDANSGGMKYIKGSHRWSTFMPNDIITNNQYDKVKGLVEPLPDIDLAIREGREEVIRFSDIKPGDVIIHHPNTVHGSGGNVSASGRRRLAASLRYVGSEALFKKKDSLFVLPLLRKWACSRNIGVSLVLEQITVRIGRLFGLVSDEDFYEHSALFASLELKNGQQLHVRDSSQIAYPVCWGKAPPVPTSSFSALFMILAVAAVLVAVLASLHLMA